MKHHTFGLDDSDFDMNMDLRSRVLQGALRLEKFITDLIKLYLDLSEENLRAFGHDSSNIPFAGKLNILLDIGVFRDENGNALDVYNDCVFVSQIRNKIAHVYECNSFAATFKMMKGGKKLMDFLDKDKATGKEEVDYMLAYLKLCSVCEIAVIDLIGKKNVKIVEKRGMIGAIMELHKISLDELQFLSGQLNQFIMFDKHGDADQLMELQFKVIKELGIKKAIFKERKQKSSQTLQSLVDKGLTVESLLDVM